MAQEGDLSLCGFFWLSMVALEPSSSEIMILKLVARQEFHHSNPSNEPPDLILLSPQSPQMACLAFFVSVFLRSSSALA